MINTLDIYRADAVIATIDIDESTVYNEKMQGTKVINCSVFSEHAYQLQEEDYINYKGEKFIIHIRPVFDKDSSTPATQYTITFEAEFYELLDTFVLDESSAVFPYYGSARDHLQLIVDNANRDGSGWELGDVDDVPEQNLDYNWTYVRTALDDIATAFKLEYKITGKSISMVTSIGRDTNLTFEMGRGKGLHAIQRSPDADKNVVTRAYGIGGTKNIDSTYRDGTYTNLVFDGLYVETPGVTAGTERVKEAKYENDDIYPKFTGSVVTTELQRDGDGKITGATITDSTIDFDVNDYLQPKPVIGMVSFLTGSLTGVDFEISNFDFASKTTTLIPNTDDNGYVLPNETNFPEVGDKYTYYNLNMPTSYVTQAQADLRTATQQYLDENKLQRLLYNVTPDEKHLRDNAIDIQIGDRATVIDTDFAISDELRFTEISYPLVNPYNVTAVIGNDIVYDRVAKLFADVLENHQQVQIVDRRSAALAKRATQNLRTLEDSIFDTDGLFDSDKINVGVLSASLGIFGVKSQNFILNKVYIIDNYLGDPNAVQITDGELVHLEISNPGNQNVWEMSEVTQSGLDPALSYYVYSKCSKIAQVGTFVVTTDQILVEDVVGYYHFLTGIIYPVNGGFRDSDFTNGITDITGARIKTGAIVSRDGLTGFDLDAGEIYGKITFSSGSTGYNNLTDKPDLSGIEVAQEAADAANAAAIAASTAASNAQATADAAESELAAISNDNILSVSEKPTVVKDINAIDGEYSIIVSQLTTYGLSTTDYTSAKNTIDSYVAPLISDMTTDSAIVGTDFRLQFTAYYNARQTALKAISDAAKNLADAAQATADAASGSGRNYFKLTTALSQFHLGGAHHGTDASYGDGTNGFWCIGISTGGGNLRLGDVINDNGPWTVSGIALTNDVGAPAIEVDICDSPSQTINVGTTPVNFALTFNVTTYANDGVYNFVDFGDIPYVYFTIKNLKIEKGAVATDWTPAPEDTAADIAAAQAAADSAVTTAAADATAKANAAIAEANATATTIAQNKADIAQAAAILAASTDAQSKADAAYSASLSAAQTYASTVANSAASAAQIAAAADALNQANAAYNNAVATATTQYNALASSLGAMAYENAVEVSKLGTTVIDGGYLVTTLIKVAELYVRNLKTADTGKRIEITGDDNSQVFYNADGTEAFRLDDDVAVDSIHITFNDPPNPPTITYTYGPGIRVGPPTGRNITLGKFNLTMMDDNGDVRNFIGVDSLGNGRIQLDASGGFQVNDGGGYQNGLSKVVPYSTGSGIKNMLFVAGVMINDNLII